jgi:syntaxin-binding protein 1
MLDEDAIIPPDRLRLIALYALFKYGLINPDIRKLLLHAQLPIPDESKLYNLELLGARVSKQLKDSKTPPPPLFPHKLASARTQEETHIDGRYVPVLKTMLEDHIHGTLDPAIFPYVKPELAPSPNEVNLSTASLRSAKPTWAKGKLSSIEPRQRIIVFVAGGATYSEARACYDVAEHTSRDVMLVTSHMLTPRLFLQQVGDLSIDRQRLALPADRPAKRAPAHLFEDEQTSKPGGPSGLPSSQGQKVGGPRPSSGRPPVDRMAAMNLNGEDGRSSGPINLNGPGSLSDSGKLRKERYDDKKKKHHFFSSKK